MEYNILRFNQLAMKKLRSDSYESAFKLLKKAELVLKKFPEETKLWAVTLNNIGCYYKKLAKPKLALHYLEKALVLELKDNEDSVNVAGTHLNICAIRSQLGDHQLALAHSLQALKILTEECSYKASLVSSLAIAYNNAGLENEYLNNLQDASHMFKAGLIEAYRTLGKDHFLTKNLTSNYFRITKKYPSLRFKRKNLTPELQEKWHFSSKESKSASPKRRFRKLSVQENHLDQNSLRFLTGERLKPMTKLDPLKKPSGLRARTSLFKQLDKGVTIIKQHEERQRAALVIQKHYRLYKARKDQKRFEQDQENLLDEFYKSRYNLSPIPLKKIYTLEIKHAKATKIQAVFRAYFAKRHFKRLRSSAITIQKHVRKYLTRKIYRLVVEAIVCIQRNAKIYLSRKVFK